MDEREWDDERCLEALWRLRHADDGAHAECRACGEVRRHHRLRRRRAWACDVCGAHVHPTADTPFARTSTPLGRWFAAAAVIVDEPDIAAGDLRDRIGTTYKVAWRLHRRLREALANEAEAELVRTVATLGHGDPVAPPLDRAARRHEDALMALVCRETALHGVAAADLDRIAIAVGIAPEQVRARYATTDELVVAALRWLRGRIEHLLEDVGGDHEPSARRLACLLELGLPLKGLLRDEYLLWMELLPRCRGRPELLAECQAISSSWLATFQRVLEEGEHRGELRLANSPGEVAERIIACANGLAIKAAVAYPDLPIHRMRGLMYRFAAEQVGLSPRALAAGMPRWRRARTEESVHGRHRHATLA